MRARRREINIFNMSLLDILCGALGAFCFMMLVALPYYKPPGEEKKLREAQEETNKLLRDIEKMKDRMKDQQSVEDLSELVKKLEAQIKLLQGEVNRLSAENQDLRRQVAELDAENKRLRPENEQLRARNQQLEASNQQLQTEKQQLQTQNDQLRSEKKKLEDENQSLQQSLNQRQPFLVLSSTDSAGETVGIYLADNRTRKDTNEPVNPDFNPEFSQGSNWTGDRVGSFPGQSTSFWITGAITPGSIFKVYVKNSAPSFGRRTISVRSALFGDLANNNAIQMMPSVTLNPVRFWAFLGTIKIDENYRPLFTPSTAEEQEAEFRRLSKTTPAPTPAGSPGVSPTVRPGTGGPTGGTPEERAFFDAMRHVREVMSAPNTEPGIEQKRREAIEQLEQARMKMEEARRRQGQPQGQGFPFGPPGPGPNSSFASPVPSPSPR